MKGFCKSLFSGMVVTWLVAALVLLAAVPAVSFWQQKASLLPGTYIIAYTNLRETAYDLYMERWAEENNWGKPDIKTTVILEAMEIKIDLEHTTTGLCKYLSNDPMTVPEQLPILFKKVDGLWVQVNLPCDWVEGEYAI